MLCYNKRLSTRLTTFYFSAILDCILYIDGTTFKLILVEERKMAKQFKYYDSRTYKVVFRSTEPNFMQIEDVDKKVLEKTGIDPRINPWIEREVVRVKDKNE